MREYSVHEGELTVVLQEVMSYRVFTSNHYSTNDIRRRPNAIGLAQKCRRPSLTRRPKDAVELGHF
jgi:hypothetical protein